ncbi:MAG: 2-oxo-4-hydroxy-4-carboxy-5-ureidoimidazoline decarboxylase [Lacipirellulaceae bacterium]
MNEQVLANLNSVSSEEAQGLLRQCCSSKWWCQEVAAARPFENESKLQTAVEQGFAAMPREDWLEAFACHPKIGDLESLKMKFAGNRQWSSGEQAGMAGVEEDTLLRFAQANEEYEKRFGYIFIVCATGKSAAEMLAMLEDRLQNDPDTELAIASGEQKKITQLRLQKMNL